MKKKFVQKPIKIGHGAFCKVYLSENNTVDKIYHKNDSKFALAFACISSSYKDSRFFKWQHFLPKFNTVEYRNHHYIVNQPKYTELDNLYPSVEEMYDNLGMYLKITDHAYGILQPNTKPLDISEFLKDFEFFEEFQTLSFDEQRNYMYFIECILNLFNIGDEQGFHWDLHTKNLMYDEQTKQLIINDPWC